MTNRNYLLVGIDDNPGDTLLIKKAISLSSLKIEFKSFADGREFLTYIFSEGVSPSLLLLDINIPIINGFDLLNIINKDPMMNDIPKIILSSSGNLNDIYRSYEKGANCYLIKPIDFLGLKFIINRTLNFCLQPRIPSQNYIKHANINLPY